METENISKPGELAVSSSVGANAEILAAQINKEKKDLKDALSKIDNIPVGTIAVDRHWYGPLDLESVKRSMANIHSDLARYIKKCGDGLQSTNQNLINTLALICLAIKGETELFNRLNDTSERLDKVDIREAGFEDIFLEWCKNNNIKDEDVQKLLESSFQRAYTLRTRLNAVKESVEQTNNRIDDLTKFVNERSEDINKELNSALERIANEVASSQNIISEKLQASLSELSKRHSEAEKIYHNISSTLREKEVSLRKFARKVAIISSVVTIAIMTGVVLIFL